MSRNGSGVYTKINTFVAGNSITASGHNANWDDIVAEMTNSVAADGQTTMTGALKAASGTVSLPGLSFASDLDCGWYRIGANNLGLALNGAKVLDVSTTGLNVVGEIKRNGITPYLVGEIKIWPGSAIPSGFLACDGSSLVRATYPDLFTAIGTTYGAADGTHFTLPDLKGRTVAGKESSATRLTSAVSGVDGATLGSAGGTQSKTLVTGNLPAYTPAGSITTTQSNVFTQVNSGGGAVVPTYVAAVSGSGLESLGTTYTSTFTGTAQGGVSTPVAVAQPTIILNYIIFAGV